MDRKGNPEAAMAVSEGDIVRGPGRPSGGLGVAHLSAIDASAPDLARNAQIADASRALLKAQLRAGQHFLKPMDFVVLVRSLRMIPRDARP